MKKILVFALVLATSSLFGQMMINGVPTYGNEWIDYSATHIKMSVEQEGMYKVTFSDLVANGFSAAQLRGADLQLHSMGKQLPIYVTTSGVWSNGDYLVFHGQGQKGELDAQLFEDSEREHLNPEFSMFSDTRSYYLSLRPNAPSPERYQEKSNDLSGALPLPENFFMERELHVFSDFDWSPGTLITQDVHYSHFVANEGFASTLRRETEVEFLSQDYYEGTAPSPRLRFRTGANNVNHLVEVSFNNSTLFEDSYSGAQVKGYESEIPPNFVRTNNINRMKIKGFTGSDNTNIAFAEFAYPRTFNANGQELVKFYSSESNFRQYIEYQNFRGDNPLVFDVENKCFVRAEKEGDLAKFLLPNAAIKSAKCFIVDESALLRPVSFAEKQFTLFDDMNPDFLILTSEVLNVDGAGGNPVKEYAAFRSSNEGGNYRTSIINVEEVYDQFGWGVSEHSLSIRNFAQYVQSKWPDFEMVFIIGKALTYSNKNNSTTINNIVPTYGRPGSDVLMFAENGKSYPYVGVGRLAARNAEDIYNYLDKARSNARLSDIANLTIEERVWRKNVIHLSGGDVNIQQDLFNKLTFMESLIETNSYGAEVTTYRKVSSDPVTTALSQAILNQINDGISMLSFFGHSSAGTFDFSVEDPSIYSNQGKLPLIFSMGCHSGDIHENTFSLSENFILTKDVGSVAFMASSGNAFADALARVGNGFYDEVGTDFYGEPISLAIRDVLEGVFDGLMQNYNQGPQTIPFSDTYVDMITLMQQNTLHGDPAIVLYAAEEPDFVVDFESLQTMSVVGTTDDFVDLEFDILNLGRNTGGDTLNNYIIHTYGNKVDTIYFSSVAPVNRLSVTVQLPNPGEAAVGKNSINIVLDVDNQIAEAPLPSAEENNDMMRAWNLPEGFCYFVFNSNAQPVYPPEYGIVYAQNLDLIASSSNALEEKSYFLLELDTTENFDSPLLQRGEVFSSPATIRWNPNITYENETVYYWRVKPRDLAQSIWNQSSFVYLDNGAPGWNQSHFYQWDDDSYETSFIDTVTRDWTYVDNINDIIIKNGLTVNDGPTEFFPNMSYGASIDQYIHHFGELESGVYLAVFDGVTGVARINSNPFGTAGDFGSVLDANWATTFAFFPYWTRTKEERADVINFMENIVQDGDYLVFMTIHREDARVTDDYRADLWAADGANGDPDIFSTLEDTYGAARVRELATGRPVPYIFVGRKNDPTFDVKEVKGSGYNSRIELSLDIIAKWDRGAISSTTIGPATKWDRLLWNIDEIDLQEDEFKFDIYGIDVNGNRTLLFENVDEFSFDLSSIDAAQYPHLELELFSSDETSRTAPQLEYWRVLYDGIPEAVLDIENKLVYQADSLLMGNEFKFETVATNVTDVDMDSLLVAFSITDANNNVQTFNKRLAPLKANESVPVDFSINTDGLLGDNEFRVEINPGPEQQEHHYFNNLGLRSFNVGGDNINPLLDVTFDGVRIMNGDIVAAAPVISVLLKDDNIFFPITDVSNFSLGLQAHPDAQSFPIDLTADNVNFFPADSTNGYCARLEFVPEPALESGEYTLFVQGTDASGNLSGANNVQLDFQVVKEATVTNILNYPNPFSTQTQFVFTLTGATVPDVFTIQIFTLSGKVVKEITKEEMGNLRIGQNRTDYRWNGTDDFGNKLGNGVYLYRLITSQVDGEDLLHFGNDNIDGFFNKGFGKLVIMR